MRYTTSLAMAEVQCGSVPHSGIVHAGHKTGRAIFCHPFTGDRFMEPISAVALSLALGAGAIIGKEVVSALVKDAYTALKDLIKNRYPKVSFEQLEQVPGSKNRRALVEQDLTASGAGQDTDLVMAAHKLIELVQQHDPAAASAVGIDLKDVAAANLRLADIAASGTGVKVEHGTFTGDIDIRGVRAGVSPDSPTKRG
jgi:hypothetical protein